MTKISEAIKDIRLLPDLFREWDSALPQPDRRVHHSAMNTAATLLEQALDAQQQPIAETMVERYERLVKAVTPTDIAVFCGIRLDPESGLSKQCTNPRPCADHPEAENGVVTLTRAQFDKLPEYSTSIPTGVYEGKQWKRAGAMVNGTQNWQRATYHSPYADEKGVARMCIEWVMIAIVEEAVDASRT